MSTGSKLRPGHKVTDLIVVSWRRGPGHRGKQARRARRIQSSAAMFYKRASRRRGASSHNLAMDFYGSAWEKASPDALHIVYITGQVVL